MAKPENDDLEQRLRKDALRIDAEVSPQLQQRISASIHSARQVRSVAAPRDRGTSYWLASSLTGVAAALLIILWLGRDESSPVVDSGTEMATTESPEVNDVFRPFPLEARTAVLTEPLDEELLHLQSDLEKARDTVKRDLRNAL